MEPESIKIIEDMRAYLAFAIKENVPFYRILGTISHDVKGLLYDDLDFLPRTSGYALRCAHCDELLYTEVLAHHHTEDGVDVTL